MWFKRRKREKNVEPLSDVFRSKGVGHVERLTLQEVAANEAERESWGNDQQSDQAETVIDAAKVFELLPDRAAIRSKELLSRIRRHNPYFGSSRLDDFLEELERDGRAQVFLSNTRRRMVRRMPPTAIRT